MGSVEFIQLVDGEAQPMGDGVFVVCQTSDEGAQNVVLTKADLEALLSAC